MLSDEHILDLIQEQMDEMFPAERKVAEYIMEHPEKVARSTITELAEQSGASDATVIRMCKRLGYKGFYQLKLCLSSQLSFIHLMGQYQKTASVMDYPEVLQLLAHNVIGMKQNISSVLLDSVVDLIMESKCIYLVAAGNSVPIAMDFGFRLGRIGIRASYNTIIENSLNEIMLGQPGEILIVISHSGSSKQVINALELAGSRGMKSVILTHSSRNPAALLADYCMLSYPATPLFQNYGIASHLYDNVLVDLILYLITCKQHRDDMPDQLEMVLSEYKV